MKLWPADPESTAEEHQLRTRLVEIVLPVLLISAVAGLAAAVAVGYLETARGLALSMPVVLVGFWLSRRGRPDLAAIAIVGVMLALVTYLSYAGFGIHDPVTFLYALTILVASLLLKRRLYVVCVVATVASAVWMIYGELSGRLVFLEPEIDAGMLIATPVMFLSFAVVARILTENLRRSLVRARVKTDSLAMINTISDALHRSLDSRTVAERAVELIVEHLRVPVVAIYTHDAEERRLRLLAAHAGDELIEAGATLPVDGSLSGLAIAQGETLVVSDTTRDRSPSPEVRELLADQGLESCMIVPISVRDQVLGTVNLIFERGSRIDERIEKQVIPLARSLGLALRNADHVTRIEHEIGERRRVEEEQRRLVAELEEKNAELEHFAHAVSHDLKSPLLTIRGHLGFLDKDAARGDMDRFRSGMERVNEAAARMQDLLGELGELSRVGRVSNPRQVVPFAELAGEAVRWVAGRLEERGVEVEVARDLPAVEVDRPRLVSALQNLIENAVKFLGDQAAPRIEIGAASEAGETVFFVRDNGNGIDRGQLEKIFGLFERLDPSIEGSGMGLALVKRIVEVHGGRIWAESEGRGTGATFRFTLGGTATRA